MGCVVVIIIKNDYILKQQLPTVLCNGGGLSFFEVQAEFLNSILPASASKC